MGGGGKLLKHPLTKEFTTTFYNLLSDTMVWGVVYFSPGGVDVAFLRIVKNIPRPMRSYIVKENHIAVSEIL